MSPRIQRPLFAFIGCVGLFILDQWSKWLFFTHEVPFSFFHGWIRSISHQNFGIAFNIPLPLWLILSLTFLATIGILGTVARTPKTSPLFFLCLGLLLGGAIGNAYDRLAFGFVRDWLLLWHRSAINVADLGVLLGLLGAVFCADKNSYPGQPS